MVLEERLEEEYLRRYEYIVISFLGKYFLRGAEKEDLQQLGMLGLLAAIRSYAGEYKKEFDPSFDGFAKTVVNRRIISEIKAYSRKKHMLLNESSSTTIFEGEEIDLLEYGAAFVDNRYDPERILLEKRKEGLNQLAFSNGRSVPIDNLSEFEKQVLLLRAEMQGERGGSYNSIAQRLNVSFKSVDNALGRVKRKLRRFSTERRQPCEDSNHTAA